MRILFLALTFIFLLSIGANAQGNYKPGYVTDLKGDTIKGYIDYHEWNENPRQVSFKSTTGNVQEYNAHTCGGFAVTGFEYYEKHIVKVSLDTVDVTRVSRIHVRDTSYRVDTVFLHTLAKGNRLSLYSYTDYIKPRYYILEHHNAQPEELAYHAYISEETSNTVQVNRYRLQLQYEAQKYSTDNKLAGMISRADYNDHDLVNIVSKINGGEIGIPQKVLGMRWFAGAGVNVNSLNYTGATPFSNKPAINSVFPKIDAGLDLFLFNGVRKLYIRFELGFTYNQFNFSNDDPSSVASGAHVTLNVNQFNAIFSPQIIYNFYNGANFKLFADVGGAVSFSSYNQYALVTTYASIDPNVQKGVPEFSKVWFTLPLKAGAAIGKNWEVYVSYAPKTKLVPDARYSGSVTSYGAGLNYFFGGK
jgi:hypothetical protein